MNEVRFHGHEMIRTSPVPLEKYELGGIGVPNSCENLHLLMCVNIRHTCTRIQIQLYSLQLQIFLLQQ